MQLGLNLLHHCGDLVMASPASLISTPPVDVSPTAKGSGFVGKMDTNLSSNSSSLLCRSAEFMELFVSKTNGGVSELLCSMG